MQLPNYVPGFGNASARLMVIGEHPGRFEDMKGRPFVGPAGDILKDILFKVGFHPNEAYYTNVVKYRPPDDDIDRLYELGISVEDGLHQLEQEVKAIDPHCILAVGGLAARITTGNLNKIGLIRGSILRSIWGSHKVVPTNNTSTLLPGGALGYRGRAFVQLDIKRAVEESRTRELVLPEHQLQVARTYLQAYNFFQSYADKKIVSVDIEVIKCIPVCISFAFNRRHAISIPLVNFVSPDHPYYVQPHQLIMMWDLVANLLEREDIQIIGQNFKFDHDKLIRPGRILIRDCWADTQILASVINPELPKSLAFLTSIYTRIPFYKDEYKEFNLKKDAPEKLYLYNAKDAAVTYEIYERLMADCIELGLQDHFFKYRMPLHLFYMKMEHNGMKVNEEVRKQLHEKYTALRDSMQARLDHLIGEHFNVKSNPEVRRRMEDLGLPPRESYDEDTLVALQANHAKDDKIEIIDLVLSLRKVHKTLGTLEADTDYDGRMRTSVRITGTETMRTSNSLLKSPLRPDKIGLAFQTMTKHGDVGADLRLMFIPDDGHAFLSADLSQAEARVVALLAEDYELLALFDKTDVHRLTTSWIFRMPLEKAMALPKDGPERHTGKSVRHGGNYDMKKRRLMLEINTNAKKYNILGKDGKPYKVAEREAGEFLKIFHTYSPKIKSRFHTAVQEALKRENRRLRGVYGAQRLFLERWGYDLFKEAYAYIPQQSVSDTTKFAGVRIQKRLPHLKFILEGHDSLMVMPRLSELKEVAEVMREEMEKPIDFSACSIPRGELKIPCEIEVGYENYKQMVKFAA